MHSKPLLINSSIIVVLSMVNRRGGRPQDNNTSDSNNKNIDHRMQSPSFPPAPDAFMSDSPRQSRPQQSQSVSHYFMDGGLHHRSSRATSLTIDHRSLPSTVTNISNSHNNKNIARPSRLFHLHNPYHGNRQGNNSSGKFTILQCLFTVLLIGYISLLLHTHALWSQDDSTSGNNQNWNHGVNQQRDNGQLSGGVRSSSSLNRDYEEHTRHDINYKYEAVDTEEDTTWNKTLDETMTNERDDYRIGSLHDLFFRTRRHGRGGQEGVVVRATRVMRYRQLEYHLCLIHLGRSNNIIPQRRRFRRMA